MDEDAKQAILKLIGRTVTTVAFHDKQQDSMTLICADGTRVWIAADGRDDSGALLAGDGSADDRAPAAEKPFVKLRCIDALSATRLYAIGRGFLERDNPLSEYQFVVWIGTVRAEKLPPELVDVCARLFTRGPERP